MTPHDAGELWGRLRVRAGSAAVPWLEEAIERVRRDRAALATVFPAVGRHIGRQPLRSVSQSIDSSDVHEWTVDDAGRALLLVAAGPGVWAGLDELYRFGDAAERRGILRALHLLPPADGDHSGGDLGLRLVDDAVRTNDPRLLAAALGPYALGRMNDDAFNQAVLKCVFVGVPLDGIDGLHGRATPELARMLAAYARERVAAGRDVPADVWPLIEAHPPHDELAAIEAELTHPVESRRQAAAAALAQRSGARRLSGASTR
jgi:hypothetical protein